MSPSVSHLSLWESVKSELRNTLPRADYETWIASLQPVGIADGKVLVLEAPSVLAEAWVNSNYAEVLRRQLTLDTRAQGMDPGVYFVIARSGGEQVTRRVVVLR